ncbi:hypothetical protein FSARC_12705 [Fusarium sarcochroum]|uniref:Uncharacterized protein n=1 Tax=Fusarium sarcochroum TaxID=1208366 RepID=A0A8H4T6G2_9HYPO|nr:hypothetical protein FSARC_12705 [Fusarium sarcochroum]
MASRVITCSRSVRSLPNSFPTGITIPCGRITNTVEDAQGVIKELNGQVFLKPQVLLGSQQYDIAKSVQDGKESAARLLDHQGETASRTDGLPATNQLYVEEAINFDKKWHVAMTVDRENYCPVIRIQELSVPAEPLRPQETLGSQQKFAFSLSTGISDSLVTDISKSVHLSMDSSESFTQILRGLFKIFSEKEAINLELDLLRTSDNQLVCADSRFSFDDAAQKRQPDLFALRDSEHEVREEVDAEKHGLVYVRMEGNIGNVVNGAGLAMATNDAISLYGGTSANFLDAGGQATKETMLQAFGIIMRDERVKAILVNIYGGITRCDMIAESIIAAASELGPLHVPMVARLQGTNSEAGLKLLADADLGIHVEADFGEAARKAVELTKQ